MIILQMKHKFCFLLLIKESWKLVNQNITLSVWYSVRAADRSPYHNQYNTQSCTQITHHSISMILRAAYSSPYHSISMILSQCCRQITLSQCQYDTQSCRQITYHSVSIILSQSCRQITLSVWYSVRAADRLDFEFDSQPTYLIIIFWSLL